MGATGLQVSVVCDFCVFTMQKEMRDELYERAWKTVDGPGDDPGFLGVRRREGRRRTGEARRHRGSLGDRCSNLVGHHRKRLRRSVLLPFERLQHLSSIRQQARQLSTRSSLADHSFSAQTGFRRAGRYRGRRRYENPQRRGGQQSQCLRYCAGIHTICRRSTDGHRRQVRDARGRGSHRADGQYQFLPLILVLRGAADPHRHSCNLRSQRHPQPHSRGQQRLELLVLVHVRLEDRGTRHRLDAEQGVLAHGSGLYRQGSRPSMRKGH